MHDWHGLGLGLEDRGRGLGLGLGLGLGFAGLVTSLVWNGVAFDIGLSPNVTERSYNGAIVVKTEKASMKWEIITVRCACVGAVSGAFRCRPQRSDTEPAADGPQQAVRQPQERRQRHQETSLVHRHWLDRYSSTTGALTCMALLPASSTQYQLTGKNQTGNGNIKQQTTEMKSNTKKRTEKNSTV